MTSPHQQEVERLRREIAEVFAALHPLTGPMPPDHHARLAKLRELASRNDNDDWMSDALERPLPDRVQSQVTPGMQRILHAIADGISWRASDATTQAILDAGLAHYDEASIWALGPAPHPGAKGEG